MIKNYLSLTKKEWNGLVILLLLIALTWLAPSVYRFFKKDKLISLAAIAAASAQLRRDSAHHTTANATLFVFNPNHLPADEWRKLGLTDGQIRVIENYEASGGRFYTRQDLKKIYAITPQDYRRLHSYINLPEKDSYAYKTFKVIELNAADSAALTQLSGIGPGFAKSIMRYRDRLGGFYKKEQLKEIFGIDSLLYLDIAPQVRVDASHVVRININTVSFNNLMVFPYLTYKQKNAIIEYRNQHGHYAALSDLKNIPIIDDGILRKIEPYISFK